ncbi:MAG: hypothetical protein H7Z41_12845, partial [Cytophagales bacterium]|nr:hypothetical protein [Armatimonadota bacterium]
ILGDTVTVLGADGTERQSAFDLAEAIGGTPHEPTCAITKRVPRHYVRTTVPVTPATPAT